MKFYIYLLTVLPIFGYGQEEAIKKVLDEQVKCWNAGDLECYMEGYWQSDQLMFIGKSGVTYGWQATLERYQKGYPTKDKMGKLDLTIKEMYPLSEDYWFVIGKWELERNAGDLEGHFSLLLRMIEGEWKVVVDHSS